jgi:NAD(P)-dependent dehydrogenase (short-subunit alcohol dehydrogenase family)
MTDATPSALITGATRGIGLVMAKHLAAQGMAMTVAARDTDDFHSGYCASFCHVVRVALRCQRQELAQRVSEPRS